MLQLRIRQHAVAEDRHQVDIDLLGDGAPRAATSTFDFRLSPQDEEDLRWYLEDFLQYPQEPEPAPTIRVAPKRSAFLGYPRSSAKAMALRISASTTPGSRPRRFSKRTLELIPSLER